MPLRGPRPRIFAVWRTLCPIFTLNVPTTSAREADLPGLFAKVNEALAATGIFPLGGIRSRAHWLDTWQMADGKHDYAFVHMTLKIGPGRSLESRAAGGGDAVCADQGTLRGADGAAATWRCRLSSTSCTRRSITNRTTCTRCLSSPLLAGGGCASGASNGWGGGGGGGGPPGNKA